MDNDVSYENTCINDLAYDSCTICYFGIFSCCVIWHSFAQRHFLRPLHCFTYFTKPSSYCDSR